MTLDKNTKKNKSSLAPLAHIGMCQIKNGLIVIGAHTKTFLTPERIDTKKGKDNLLEDPIADVVNPIRNIGAIL